ncbi:MAG: adenylate/guanylate cyclase domain-containing protein [Planctomycetota bacterium]|jgi:adenylate cyclase
MLHVTVSNEWQHHELTHEEGPLLLGRQPDEGAVRLVINDPYVSRRQLRLEQGHRGRVLVENLSRVAVSVDDGSSVEMGQPRSLTLPCRLLVGATTIELSRGADAESETLHTIARPTQQADRPTSLATLGESPSPATLAKWFEGLLAVQRSAAGSGEFYDEAARAVVELIGLDGGLVMLLRGGRWQVVASFPPAREGEPAMPFSRHVLAKLQAERRTYFESYEGPAPSASLAGIRSVVASPVLDGDGEVIGAVYGVRETRSVAGGFGIAPLEAQVVQLLAGAVSAGLARLDREAELVRTRVQFEQFFAPELVRELQRNPDLLEGQERRVTLLFSDVRSFTRISERLGARDTYRFLGDVMDAMTNRIADHGGVIVDYHGDGLAAMWNAPANDGQHSRHACRAGLSMLEELPRLDERWADRLDGPVRVGVGINTGTAQVGNAGSRRVLKYGPLGHAVNLASRVEGATKHLGVPLLITDSTRAELDHEFVTRRLCRVRAVGMTEPVSLYECRDRAVDEAWSQCRDRYERALALYEEGRWDEAAETIDPLIADGQDRPAALLAGLIERARRERPDPFDPVFQLDAK